jgi:endogenous inhibitor of DNA gyrase (YacG/DUF329 family)
MLMPERSPVGCPQCQRPIQIPLQAELRARGAGTALSCPSCGTAVLMRLEPALSFTPLSTPRRTTPAEPRPAETRPDLEHVPS